MILHDKFDVLMNGSTQPYEIRNNVLALFTPSAS